MIVSTTTLSLARPFSTIRGATGAIVTEPCSQLRQARFSRLLMCTKYRSGATVIGYDESALLDVEPAGYVGRMIKRETRACRSCEQGSVTMAVVSAPHARQVGSAPCTIS